MAGIPNVAIRITADTASAVRDINQVNTALGSQVTSGNKASAALRKAAVPAAAAFAAVGAAAIKFTKAAAEDADAQAKLAQSLERTTGATVDQVKAAEDFIGAMSDQTGTADDELRPALAKLAAETGSVTKGQAQLKLAMDIAAASGKSLETATAAVVKADQGRLGALQKLVPGIDAATIKNKDATAALAEAAALTSGAAAKGAETYGGQMKIMTNQVAEAEEEIGSAFLPVLAALVPVLRKVTDFVTNNTSAVTALMVAVGAVSGVILAANAAMKVYAATQVIVKVATAAWTAAQWLLNVALNANPIGLIVLAIVGAVGLIYALKLAYDKSDAFRDIVNALWQTIKTGISLYLLPLKLAFIAVAEAIERGKELLASPFGLYVLSTIKTAAQAVADVFAAILSSMRQIAAITFARLIGAIQRLIDWISRIDFPSPPKWLTSLPGKIPGLGRALPTVGVGARGASAAGVGVASSGAGALTINVFGAVDAEGTARQIRRLLDAHDRRQGRIP